MLRFFKIFDELVFIEHLISSKKHDLSKHSRSDYTEKKQTIVTFRVFL